MTIMVRYNGLVGRKKERGFEMAKAVALYTGGIQEKREIAVRNDGQAFSRYQVRDPRFGTRWTGWKKRGDTFDINALPQKIDGISRARAKSACLNDAVKFNDSGVPRVRLPNN